MSIGTLDVDNVDIRPRSCFALLRCQFVAIYYEWLIYDQNSSEVKERVELLGTTKAMCSRLCRIQF